MNPITLSRLVSNIAVVAVIAAFLVALMFNDGIADLPWGWIIFLTALGGVALQFITSLLRPSDIAAAFDEQVRATETGSYAFGYWISLAVFLVFLVLVLTGRMSAPLAFFVMGAPLGAAPALYMLVAHVRGRAG